MKIAINDKLKISALQHEFNTQFPFLKIEFFIRQPSNGSNRKITIPNTKTLGELNSLKKKEKITITPQMTVNELEKQFKANYGLSVQVFRKSGRSWLETSVTDNWTLKKQDEEGRELSSLVG